jgi:glycosyltransferase involved in cell wall biosynthesis
MNASNTPLRILMITPEPPRPDRSAADRRIREILQLLAPRHRVHLHWLEHGFRVPELHGRYIREIRGLDVDCSLDYRRLASTLVRHLFDIVYIEYWFAAEKALGQIRARQPWAQVIVDSVDLHFAREEAAMAYDPPPGGSEGIAGRKARELAVYRSADLLVTVTEDDREALAPYGPLPPIHTIPIVVPLRERPAIRRDPRLMFVGEYDHAPNRDAVTWFAREIWPAVRARVPNARFDVIGNRPKPEILALAEQPGIEVLGYVPDTNPYLDRSAALVAPLRFGAGMKGKVTEALASALPVITTSIGAQGFGAVSGEHLRIADDPADFAAAVADVLLNPEGAERMGRAGQMLLSGLCTPEVVDRSLTALIDQAAQGRRSRRVMPPDLLMRQGLDRVRDAASHLKRLVVPRPPRPWEVAAEAGPVSNAPTGGPR